MIDTHMAAAIIGLAVGILIGAVPVYNAWQTDTRNLRHHLRVAQGERDLDRQRQMAAHPAGGSTVVAFERRQR